MKEVKKYEPQGYIFKEPDLKGGFIYTSIENLHVVERDNEGGILEVRPFNLIKKGIETDKGKIIEITKKNVILDKEDNLVYADKYLFNSYLLKKSIDLRDDLGIKEIISKRDKSKKTSNIIKALGMAITSKDFKIPKVSYNNTGKTNAGGEKQETNVNSGGVQWNVKGGIKPGHKWIERKQSETNPDEYIYLYELPSGKRQWQDKSGKEINDEVNNPNEIKVTYKDYLKDIKKGDRINYNGQSGNVVDNGDKLIVIDTIIGRSVIDKIEHEKAIAEHANAKPNDMINYKGQQARVLPTKDFAHSNTMLLQTPDRKWHEVKRESKIKVTRRDQKVVTKETAKRNRYYNNEEEEQNNNIDYYNEIEKTRPLTVREVRLKAKVEKQNKINEVWMQKQEKAKNIEDYKISSQQKLEHKIEVIGSDKYKQEQEEIEGKGYKIQSSGFSAIKRVKLNGLDYKLEANYDENKGWETSIIEGAYRDLVMDGEKYRISDIDEDNGGHVQYIDKDNDKRWITVDELKNKNGAKVVVPTASNKGLVSTKVQTKELLIGGKLKVPYHTEILEAEDIIPSSIIDGDMIIDNPKYTIGGAQNRERKGGKDLIIINNIAKNPDFDQLDDLPVSDFGAPILNKDNEVLGGNARFMGINEHYKENREKYKEDLTREAKRLGFDPEEISKMKNPVLVRMTNIGHEESASTGVQTNAEGKAVQSDIEVAKSKIAQMTPRIKEEIDDAFRAVLKDDEWKDADTIRKLLDNRDLGGQIYQILSRKSLDQNGKYVNGIITDYETNKYWDSEKENVVKDAIIPILFGILYNGAGRYLSHIPNTVEEGLTSAIGSVLNIDEEKSPLFRGKLNEAISIIGKYTKFKDDLRERNRTPFIGTALSYITSINDMFDGEAIADPTVCGLVTMLEESKPTEIKAKLKSLSEALYKDFFSEGKSVEEAVAEITPPPEQYKNGIHMDRANKSLFYKMRKTFFNLLKK